MGTIVPGGIKIGLLAWINLKVCEAYLLIDSLRSMREVYLLILFEANERGLLTYRLLEINERGLLTYRLLEVYETSLYHWSILSADFHHSEKKSQLDMFPGTWGCPRHVRFACHTSSMHIQSTKAMYLQIHSK